MGIGGRTRVRAQLLTRRGSGLESNHRRTEPNVKRFARYLALAAAGQIVLDRERQGTMIFPRQTP